jgi:hypothetical protein
MDRGGIEPPTPGFSVSKEPSNDLPIEKTTEKTSDSQPQICHQNGVLGDTFGDTSDRHLALIVERWPTLSPHTRGVILEIIKVSGRH